MKLDLAKYIESNEKFQNVIVELTKKIEELSEELNISETHKNEFANTNLNLLQEISLLKKELKKVTDQHIILEQELKFTKDQNIKVGNEMENFHRLLD